MLAFRKPEVAQFLQKTTPPTLYVFTTPHDAEKPWVGKRQGTGVLKIGYTQQTDVETRIWQQFPTKTSEKQPFTLLLSEPAIDTKGAFFTDKAIHHRLKQKGYHNPNGEWFECTLEEVKVCLAEVKLGVSLSRRRQHTYKMRPEQKEAVAVTKAYFDHFTLEKEKTPPKFLWNAKMRFGKTFTTYQLAKAMGWKKVLVLTYKPAVQSAWEEDLTTHVDFEGWQFIGKGQPFDGTDESKPYVWFASFQDILGKDKKGGIKERHEALYLTEWDCVVLDEYHFGAWRESAKDMYEGDPSEKATDEAIDTEALPLQAKQFLYLSGTPFRALASGEFMEDQIFNWTYKDEQLAKQQWEEQSPTMENPYAELPKMVLMTYEMPPAIREIALKGELNEFELNEFFKAKEATEQAEQTSLFKETQQTTKRYVFEYEAQVQQWLNLIRGQYLEPNPQLGSIRSKPPVPFEDVRLLSCLNHTFWFLPNVASCHAMATLLKKPQNVFFHEYGVVVCAGKEAGNGLEALKPVEEKMANPFATKTITLSCGKLTTGVSVKPWGGIFMLRNTTSPETYFQAAFRVQTPWALTNQDGLDPNKKMIIKPICYVFDFAPNRALSLISEYTSRLTPSEGGTTTHELEEFLRFLPVLCYDGSTMEALSPSELLDFVASGTGGSMLARKWQDAKLVNVDNQTLERLLAHPNVLEALQRIEGFKDLGQDISRVIATEKSLNKLKKEKGGNFTDTEKTEISKEEKKKANFKKELREKLLKFVTRVPVFMYLTEKREETLQDVIRQIEPDLFKKVTALSITDFDNLCTIGVFHAQNMNAAIFSFKRFEESSLTYAGGVQLGDTIGLWDKVIHSRELV
jgi:hypothetical protein